MEEVKGGGKTHKAQCIILSLCAVVLLQCFPLRWELGSTCVRERPGLAGCAHLVGRCRWSVLLSLLIFLHALGCVLETWLEAGPPSCLRTGLAAFTAQVLFMSRCSIHSASVLGGMAEQKHLKI